MDLATVYFEDSDVACCLLVQVDLLGDSGDQVANDTILSDKYLQRFLWTVRTRHLDSVKPAYLFTDAITEPDHFHNLLGFVIGKTCLENLVVESVATMSRIPTIGGKL